mmetsp:Transcript_9012/g.23335  ORF Transcript_9012/g.23335 Transcript_9012/m.23335 type:complete len:203 (-) Transcript_9012:495-1103(-)
MLLSPSSSSSGRRLLGGRGLGAVLRRLEDDALHGLARQQMGLGLQQVQPLPHRRTPAPALDAQAICTEAKVVLVQGNDANTATAHVRASHHEPPRGRREETADELEGSPLPAGFEAVAMPGPGLHLRQLPRLGVLTHEPLEEAANWPLICGTNNLLHHGGLRGAPQSLTAHVRREHGHLLHLLVPQRTPVIAEWRIFSATTP